MSKDEKRLETKYINNGKQSILNLNNNISSINTSESATNIIDANILIDACETLGLPELRQVYEDKTKPEEFKILRTLAKGGYGEVYVVDFKGVIYALKKVAKQTVLKNSNTTFFMNEKRVMTSVASEWLVQCHSCVQDEYWLYYLMDFIPGGDLMGYLSRLDVISETGIRFFSAEIFAAVNAMHENGWIHRDLKPDNILIGNDGHIKLGDFGSSIAMKNGKAESFITVGTPDYVSPDLLVRMGERIEYGSEVDFWTVGVIIYEMLCGTTPFYSESLVETYGKISKMAYEFPEGVEVSEELKDLIAGLLCEKTRRLDFSGVCGHSFFAGVDWENLRTSKAFYVPRVGERGDISNFVDTDFVPETCRVICDYKEFVGFTFDPIHCARLLKNLGCKIFPDNRSFVDIDNSNNLVDKEIVNANKTAKMDNNLVGENNSKVVNLEMIDFNLVEKNEKNEKIENLKTADNSVMSTKLNKNHIFQNSYHIDDRNEQLKKVLDKELILDSETVSLINDTSKFILSKMVVEAMDLLRDLKETGVSRRLSEIGKIVFKLHHLNTTLASSFEESQTKCVEMSRRQEELKKELRIRRTEIREYQQRVEQEIYLRCELEKQLEKSREKEREKPIMRPTQTKILTLIVIDAMSNRPMRIDISDSRLILTDFPSDCLNKHIVARVEGNQLICGLEHIFIRDLRNHELHHMPYKKRPLVAVVHFLGEPTRTSSSSGTRRSLRALETDLAKEEKILRGLENLINVLDGVTLTDALAHKHGSEKKMRELRDEIEKAKKSTLTEYEVEDNEKVAEFNSHLFYEKTVARGTLCDNCNDPLYGHVKQAYCCRDCLLVVHKHCYILVDVSCELRQSMKKGTCLYVACATTEEKERLIKITN